MASSNAFQDNEPLTHFGRWPVYVSTVMVALHFLGICLSGVIAGSPAAAIFLPFDPEFVFKLGKWWTVFTYSFVDVFDIFNILGLFVFYRAAVEIEKFYGRWHVLKLFTFLLLAAPAVSTAFWMGGSQAPGLMLRGSFFLNLSFFVAFATLYPNIEFLGTVSPKPIAIFFLAVACAFLAATKNLVGLTVLFASVGIAHFYMNGLRTGGDSAVGEFFRGLTTRRRPKLRVLPKPSAPPRPMPRVEMAESSADSEVDALLDKIAQSGIASLTAAERARLEKAREELLKKERQ